jgi:hypothetical protein
VPAPEGVDLAPPAPGAALVGVLTDDFGIALIFVATREDRDWITKQLIVSK